MPEFLLRVRDVARLLSVGGSTVYRLAEKGVIPAIKIPGTNAIRFRRERIEALLLRWERDGAGRRRRRGQGAARPEA